MPSKRSRPGRRLVVFAIVVAALYGGVALGGVWKPKLGLDLQGGTRITLEASTPGGGKPSQANLQEARTIISQRVNGSGVSESTVAIQGGRNIVVEIPGKKRGDLVDSVKQTAQLRFRLVALEAPGQPQPTPTPSPSASGSTSPNANPSATSSAKPGGTSKSTAKPTATASSKASPKGRALSSGLIAADQKPSKKPSAKPSAKGSAAPSASGSALPSGLPSATPSAPALTKAGAPVDKPLQWMDNPGSTWLQKFQKFTCPKGSAPPKVDDVPDQPLVTCDQNGNKLLLSKAVIEGTQLKSAQAAAPDQQSVQWRVVLTFKSEARKTFATVTQAIAQQTSPLTGQQKQFAIVLDGKVISAPTVSTPINNGSAEITGNFTQASAQSLATSLKYGALPRKFKAPVVSQEGPTLASDQLSGGLMAGAVGLALVMLYCLLYYRGLGLVVIASLVIAGLVTYAVVLAMSQAVHFTLTLPGIAGLIVAVGITADSLIVYFERIRDEMRTGKSMRVAVEAGWIRARTTCLAADGVSLLAAVVLYIFSIDVVKGFAFALGISTVIDLVVFFLFTKPMVSWLATFRFFSSGHKLSGLSPDHVGLRPAPAPRRSATSPAGGNA